MRRFPAALSAGLLGLLMVLLPAAGAHAGADPVVTISADCGGPLFCFTPASITVSDGDTVTWSNQSGAEHIIVRCDAADCTADGGGTGTDTGFTTGNVPRDDTFSHTFHGVGTYLYYCSIHGYAVMHGVVVVKAAAPTTTTTTTTATTLTPRTTPGSDGTVVTTAAAATTAASAPVAQLARTGGSPSGTLTVGVAALVLGIAGWGVARGRRFTG